MKALEDLGFYCVDNLPVALLDAFTEQIEKRPESYPRVALGIDARTASKLDSVPQWLQLRRDSGIECQMLFITADSKALIKRFSETRRSHPLTTTGAALPEALAQEEELVAPLLQSADWVLDSTDTNIHQLRRQVRNCVAGNDSPMRLVLESFAFKRGVPQDVDFLFDARNLPNPYWQPELRELTGLDKAVQDWLLAQDSCTDMAQDILVFLNKWLPDFTDTERSYVTIGIGCTGGRHRSVCLVNWLSGKLSAEYSDVLTSHRELKQ